MYLKPALTITLNGGIDIFSSQQNYSEANLKDLQVSGAVSFLVIPLHCELVVGGRIKNACIETKGCRSSLDRGEILDPYFLFSL